MICDVTALYAENFSEFMGDRFASPVHLPVKRGMARHPLHETVASERPVIAKSLSPDLTIVVPVLDVPCGVSAGSLNVLDGGLALR